MAPHSTWLLLSMAFVAGAFMPVQAGINGQLAKHITSPLAAATISFVVGSLALLLILVLLRSPVAIEGFQKTQWWHWIGGLIGAFFVFGATYAAPKIGALLFMALVLAGQLSSALILDHQGWLGFRQSPLTATKLLGMASIVLGVWLVRRG